MMSLDKVFWNMCEIKVIKNNFKALHSRHHPGEGFKRISHKSKAIRILH